MVALSEAVSSLEEGIKRDGIKFKHQSSKTHTKKITCLCVCSHKNHSIYFAIISFIPHDSSEMYNILLFVEKKTENQRLVKTHML